MLNLSLSLPFNNRRTSGNSWQSLPFLPEADRGTVEALLNDLLGSGNWNLSQVNDYVAWVVSDADSAPTL
jgi:hypothetical protein